jgi:hypothetical protein
MATEKKLATAAQILAYLDRNPDETKTFAKNPKAFFEKYGLKTGALDMGHGHEKLQAAEKLLQRAKLSDKETLVSALPKLSKAASEVFGPDYRVDIEPFAISFLEKPQVGLGFKWTVTGRIRCTWDGWDGCSIGLDW